MLSAPEDTRPERLDTVQHTWVFDTCRHRFARLPRGRDPLDPAVPMHWRAYYSFRFDPRASSFTIALDPAGTRLMRGRLA